MPDDIAPNNFRDAVFMAPSRTYGEIYMEPIIRAKFGLKRSGSGGFDAVDAKGTRYEIKSGKALEQSEKPDGFDSLYDAIVSTIENSMPKRVRTLKQFRDGDTNAAPNIQNVKRSDFDAMYYNLLFSDCVVIFKIDRDKIKDIPGWSEKHGRYDKLGENGQFTILPGTIQWHLDNTLVEICSWEDIAKVASAITDLKNT